MIPKLFDENERLKLALGRDWLAEVAAGRRSPIDVPRAPATEQNPLLVATLPPPAPESSTESAVDPVTPLAQNHASSTASTEGPQPMWSDNLALLQGLVGRRAGYDPVLSAKHRDTEHMALDAVKDGQRYGIGQAVRDLAPGVLGALLAGAFSTRRNRGVALGQVAGASIEQIGKNFDRDQQVIEQNRRHALNEANMRLQKGGTEFGQLAQLVGLQQNDQQLKNRMAELGQLEQLRGGQLRKQEFELADKDPKSPKNLAGVQLFNEMAVANKWVDANGQTLVIPEGMTVDQYLKVNQALPEQQRLAMMDAFNRKQAEGSGMSAAAATSGRINTEYANLGKTNEMAAQHAQSGELGSRAGNAAGAVLQSGQTLRDPEVFRRANETQEGQKAYRDISGAAASGQTAISRLQELGKKHPFGINQRLNPEAYADYSAAMLQYITADVALDNGGVVNQGEVDTRMKQMREQGLTPFMGQDEKAAKGLQTGFRRKAESKLQPFGVGLDGVGAPAGSAPKPKASTSFEDKWRKYRSGQ